MSYRKSIEIGSDLLEVEVARDPVTLGWAVRLKNGRGDISGSGMIHDKEYAAELDARSSIRKLALARAAEWRRALKDLDLSRVHWRVRWNQNVRIDQSGCHLWLGEIIPDTKSSNGGHGKFHYEGKVVIASRFAWELENGPIPKGMFVLHSCDNRACVNPRHLRSGTQSDNLREMIARGRSKQQKLTLAAAKQIRQLLLEGHTQTELGRKFGVSRTVIRNIQINRSYVELAHE